mgnify:CR=1 FL=1
MKKMIVILIAGVVVGIAISGLYKHFVTDRITDGDGMVNEFANVFRDGDTLKSIHWTQSGSSYDHGFCFDLEEADGAYTISGWCIDTGGSGEKVERTDAPLTAEEYQRILQAPGPWMLEHPEPLVGELYCKMKLQQLRPRVLVSYVREPYIYQAGNVRVTFDSHIRTSLFERDFAEGTLPDISATDAPGDTILEVKFDAFLPEVIRGLLQVGTLRQQAFSKYGACRRFG